MMYSYILLAILCIVKIQFLFGDTCATTTNDVAKVCGVEEGVICHSFCVKRNMQSSACDFRGSYVKSMVSFHDQGVIEEENKEDMSATKIYRFMTPAFAGFPYDCGSLDDYIADLGGEGTFVNNVNHVSFELDRTTCTLKDDDGTGLDPFYYDCSKNLISPSVYVDVKPGVSRANKTFIGSIAMGADEFGVRDYISYRDENTGYGQDLTYQLTTKAGSIKYMSAGTSKVCVNANCTGNDVEAGQFKFSVGTEITNKILSAKHRSLRLQFKVKYERLGTKSDDDKVIISDDNTRLTFVGFNNTEFDLEFATEYVYYKKTKPYVDGVTGKANVTVSNIDGNAFEYNVFVDLMFSDEMLAECNPNNGFTQVCYLMYDPDMSVVDPAWKPNTTGLPPYFIAIFVVGGLVVIVTFFVIAKKCFRKK